MPKKVYLIVVNCCLLFLLFNGAESKIDSCFCEYTKAYIFISTEPKVLHELKLKARLSSHLTGCNACTNSLIAKRHKQGYRYHKLHIITNTLNWFLNSKAD